ERIGVERLVHAREELVDALDRADYDVAVAAATELPQAAERDQEGVPPALERGGENVPGRHRPNGRWSAAGGARPARALPRARPRCAGARSARAPPGR